MSKILGLYTTPSLNVLRRVFAPFSVLARRQYRFSFFQTFSFDADFAAGYDAIVMPNWILAESEMDGFRRLTSRRAVIYDLTDIHLLENAQVVEMLQCAALVTVPNSYLLNEVKHLAQKSALLPSLVPFEHFMQRRKWYLSEGEHSEELTALVTKRMTNNITVVGCFGNHDWSLVREAIAHVREKHPGTIFLGDDYSSAVLGDLVTTNAQVLLPEYYPGYLAFCDFGLVPTEQNSPVDPIWAQEYGILNKPVIASSGGVYRRTTKSAVSPLFVTNNSNAWVEAIENLSQHQKLRAVMGHAAYETAFAQRAVKGAESYLKAYQKVVIGL